MADVSNGVMAGAYGIQAVAELGSAYAQSEAIRAQGQFARAMTEINNRFAALAAKDALKAGEERVAGVRRRLRRTVGAQRAAAAAQGLDVNEDVARELQSDTYMEAEDEIITQRNNAWREAFGIKTQATFNSLEADNKVRAANFTANQTLLTGGMQAAGNLARAGAYGYKQYKDSYPNAAKDGDKIEGFSGTLLRSDYEKRKKGSIFGLPSLTGDE